MKKWKIYLLSFFLSAVLGVSWFLIHNPYLFYESKTIQSTDDVIRLVYENSDELEQVIKDWRELEQKREVLRQIPLLNPKWAGEASLADIISSFGMNKWFDALGVETAYFELFPSGEVCLNIGFETEENKTEGVIYSDTPMAYEPLIEMQEENGVYTQSGDSMLYGWDWTYETEKINDEWYYYCVIHKEK